MAGGTSSNKSLDFLVLGAAKSGTTSLHHLLASHPSICLSEPKETWFFDGAEFAHGMQRYLSEYFSNDDTTRLRGEVATSYLFAPFVPDRLQRTAPETRLVAIVRDPVERAFSDWWMMYSRGFDPMPFEEAIEDNLRRLENGPDFSDPADWQRHLHEIRERGRLLHRTYVDYGFYAGQLERFRRAGWRDRLLVLQFERLKLEGTSYLEPLYDHLGVDIPQPSELGGQALAHHNEALPSRRIGAVVAAMQRTGLLAALPEVTRTAGKHWVGKIRRRESMSDNVRKTLGAIYQGQLDELESLPHIDLSLWPSVAQA